MPYRNHIKETTNRQTNTGEKAYIPSINTPLLIIHTNNQLLHILLCSLLFSLIPKPRSLSPDPIRIRPFPTEHPELVFPLGKAVVTPNSTRHIVHPPRTESNANLKARTRVVVYCVES